MWEDIVSGWGELRSPGRPTTPARKNRAVWGPRRGRPSLRGLQLTLRDSRRRVQSFYCGLHFGRHFVGIAHSQPGGGNYFANPHFQRLALDVVGVHGQQVEGAGERNRYDIGLRLDRQKKCARQKRLNLSILRTAALGKDDQRRATSQAPQR